MNAEHILDAIGLLDDDLIQEAETYTVRSGRPARRAWAAVAACLAVVIALGYGAAHVRMGNSASGGANNGGAAGGMQNTTAAGEPAAPGESIGQDASPGLSGEGDSTNSGSAGASAPAPGEPAEGDFCAAIMVDGVLYWSTDTPVPGEVDESAIRTVTSYTDTQPEEDGQTNFDRGLTTRYAMTDMGLVVLMDQEWILFDPVPPWER